MTLTSRLVVRSLAVIAVVLVGVALLTAHLVNVSGRDDVDRLLRDEAQLVGEELAQSISTAAGAEGEVDSAGLVDAARQALLLHPSGSRHVTVLEVAGVRLQSEGGPSAVATLARSDEFPGLTAIGSIRTTDTSVGPVRGITTVVLDAREQIVATITVLSPLDDVRASAIDVLKLAAVAGAIGLAAGAIALWTVVRRSMRPLRDVAVAAAAVSADDLSARVPVPDGTDEVAQLAEEFNEMLERIEHDHVTRRRYVAAVSHEVRTPLAVAEGHLELLASLGPGDTDDVRATADVVRGELQRLRRVLDDLIAVNRGDHQMTVHQEAVFVPDLAESLRRRIEALPYGERVTIGEAPTVAIVADQARLEQCVANLVDNAIDHTPESTRVQVTFISADHRLIIEVSDDGPGIAPQLLPHVFEPFVTTRSDPRGGTAGLGLAVVRGLVEALGGTVTAASSASGTVMRIELSRP